MFHTFEGIEPAGRQGPGRDRSDSSSRRVTTARACTSCRHRKIKCDGKKPCEACVWYKKADQCQYTDPRPSDRRIKEVSAALETCRRVLGTLFPNINVESLDGLPREKLIELIAAPAQQQSPGSIQQAGSPATTLASVGTHVSREEGDDDNLEILQTMPSEPIDRQNTGSSDPDQGLSDDVNALALCARQPSSYLGISSLQAILKVIVLLNPGCAAYLSPNPVRTGKGSMYGGQASWLHHAQITPFQSQHLPLTEIQFLDAYFLHFHAFAPMFDEHSFRETYLTGRRRDKPWLALLNIVLALGSVAATNPDDMTHQIYYQRCEDHLGLSALGNPQIEIIQTLGLISGWYCHYTSQPNLAQSFMGAAMRLATARGLHKESIQHDQMLNAASVASLDINRRTWWSLFCMDTWAGMTLGRPSMGRGGLTITVKPPTGRGEDTVNLLPLIENIRFARIATEIQELLAAAPLGKQQAAQADAQLVEWWENLPAILKDYEPCPERLKTVRNVMRWRYYNQRILIYRPTLLSYAMRRVSYLALRTEERMAIEKCREIAEVSIHQIASTAPTNQLWGWNAVWWTFQASMVPLLGLFINDPTANDPRASIKSLQNQVETAMVTLARMHSLGHTAKTSLDAVSRIFEASKHCDNLATHGSSALPVLATASAMDSSMGRSDGMGMGMMLLQQHELGQAMAGPSEGAQMEAHGLINPFMNDPNDQQMWDFLSWSDNSMWPGLVTDIAMV